MEGYKMFGKDWRRVAEFVGTRNNVQVRTHAQKSFKKMRKLELARQKTQRIIAAHRSSMSESERAKVLDQIETASRIAMRELRQDVGSLLPPMISPDQPQIAFFSPQSRHAPSNSPPTSGMSSLPSFSLSKTHQTPFMPSPPQLLSPLMMQSKQPRLAPMNIMPCLDIAASSAATAGSSTGPNTPQAFSMNGAVFPRLTALPPFPVAQLPQPQQQQQARFSFQNHFKFFQDWSVDVK